MSKELFAREALAQIPKILTLQDRNPHSPTYGCFDRNFWHFKIIDFPSGMSQEFVWPLALAATTEIAENPYFNSPAIRDWAAAGIRYAARSAHPDGSCDDYFPFEKAGGAAAFSLLACLETYTLLDLHDEEMLHFFRKRADWLAHHHESGRLTNHQALIVLCLDRASRVLRSDEWKEARQKRLARVLEWQNEEGWFQEYEGCDPGYHTLTVSLLAQIHHDKPTPQTEAALKKAVGFVAEFVHPDGSFGGEYTSRNTYNFFPHGFEIAGAWLPEALEINDRFLRGLAAGRGACYADDHIIGHHTWSYLLAYRNFVGTRPQTRPRKTGRTVFKNARILIDRRNGCELYLALNKGGVFRFFRGDQLVASDTHFSVQVGGEKTRTATAHLIDDYQITMDPESVTIRGSLGWAKQKQMTTFNLIVLRLLMYTVGRFNPDMIRKMLQKVLITGKQTAPFNFVRQLHWTPTGLEVLDELHAESWENVEAVGLGSSQTSIYVVMSRTYQSGQLQPWRDLTHDTQALEPGAPLKLERIL